MREREIDRMGNRVRYMRIIRIKRYNTLDRATIGRRMHRDVYRQSGDEIYE